MAAETTVFVVDDDGGTLKSMRWLLESHGLEVETYRSAQQFLDACDPGKAGCLILDVRMPDMDGLQLQERLDVDGVGLPIVFVTGYADVPASVRAMKRGAIDFLQKPIIDQELLKLVHEAIEKDLERRLLKSRQCEVQSRLDKLSEREREVKRMLVDGKSLKQIAVELGISHQTVAKHRARILEKLKVRSEPELLRLLVDHSLPLA